MKRYLKPLIIATIVLLGLWAAKYYFLDNSTVEFTFAQSVSGIEVYRKSDNKKVTSITSTKSAWLSHDDYYAVPVGDIVSGNHIAFSSPSNGVVAIDPDYNAARLEELAIEAITPITTQLNAIYPSIMPQYNLQALTLFKKGEWAGGLLVNIQSTQNETKDLYRFVAHQENGVWKIVGAPDLVFSKVNALSIPSDVLIAVNQLNVDLSNN